MRTRFAIGFILGVFSFALVVSAELGVLCFLAFASCSGSTFQPWALLISGVGAVFILAAALLINLATRRQTWYRPWHIIPLCVLVSIVLPRIYAVATGSDTSLTAPFRIPDAIFGLAGLAMGTVFFHCWRLRSNGGGQPTSDVRPQ